MALTIQQILAVNVDAEFARRNHIDFMAYCWQKPNKPLIVGRHTSDICSRIDKAIDDYRAGKSTRLIIKIPFRHGKSDIVSRYLPPRYLGLFPNNEVMVATYGSDLTNTMSSFARGLIETDQYIDVFPHIKLDPNSHNIQNWKLDGKHGQTHWSGIGGSQTGRGFDLGIIDDYLKNRQDAESITIRNKQWDWFTNSFLTRAAPVSIIIILATPWHTDDIIGRIENEMENDPEFPKFDIIKYPAFDRKYKYGVLFPERFGKAWYTGHRSTLGIYGTASLLQCNPQAREGNLFKVDRINFTNQLPTGLRWVRAWDLASTEKQLVKRDPDWTAGIKMAVDWVDDPEIKQRVPHVYIADMVRMQEEAPERNKKIVSTGKRDGESVCIAIESVAAYKDTVAQIKKIFKGLRTVSEVNVSKDKIVRSAPATVAMEAGNVTMIRGEWNDSFIDELSAFPSGKHDDQVDALSTGFEFLSRGDVGTFKGQEKTSPGMTANWMDKELW